MDELPIACSLEGSEQAKRLQEIAGLCERALLGTEETRGGLKLCFADGPGVREELEELIEFESRCCSFLGFELRPAQEALLLEVTGPQEARPLIRAMFGLGVERRC